MKDDIELQYWDVIAGTDKQCHIKMARKLLASGQIAPHTDAGYSALCVLLSCDNAVSEVIGRIEAELLNDFYGKANVLLPLLGHAYQRLPDLHSASLIFFVCERYGYFQGKNAWCKEAASSTYCGLAESIFFRQHNGTNYNSISLRARLLYEMYFDLNRLGASAVSLAQSGRQSPPEFIIVGSAKCGTSFLYDLITQLPGVWRRWPKETHFFSNYFGLGSSFYFRFFADCPAHLLCGEASPDYLDMCNPNLQNHADVAWRIFSTVPKTRIIIILRDPVERAISLYGQMASNELSKGPMPSQMTIEDLSFEDMRSYRNGGILESGKYVFGVRRFTALFGESRSLILHFAELEQPQQLAKKLGKFLGVEVPNTLRLEGMHTNASKPRGIISTALASSLQDYYSESLEELKSEFQIDLGAAKNAE